MIARLTIKDIAELAGVAPITVSRVINNKPDVSAATSRKVQAIIEEHNWLPNVQARGLVGGRTFTLGFMTMGVTSSFTTDLLEAVEQVSAEHRYGVLLMATDQDEARASAAMGALLQRGVDGIILSGPVPLRNSDLTRARERGVPMVTLYVNREGVPMLGVDYREAGRLAAEHLRANGRRRCLYVHDSQPLDRDTFTLARWEGFAGGGEDFHAEPLHQPYGETEALRNRLERGDIGGIFCQNDRCLPDVYRAAWELGLDVPGDLAVVGCNDEAIARSLTPRVTSIDVAKERIATQAALSLIKTTDRGRPRGRLFQPTLIVRESSVLNPRRRP